QLDMPEGEQFITAEKDDLSREVYATISVPEEGESTQRISLMLSENAVTFASSHQTKNTSNGASWWIYLLLPVLLIPLLFIIRLLIIKSRGKKQAAYIGDPLEAENYTQHVIPSLPTGTSYTN